MVKMVVILEDGKVAIGKGDVSLGRPMKTRKKVWAKLLEDKVDTSKLNGYAFTGRFLKVRGDPAYIDAVIEVPAFIVATAAWGSSKHPRTGIILYKIDEEGNIEELFSDYYDTQAEMANAVTEIAKIVNQYFSNDKDEMDEVIEELKQAITLAKEKKKEELIQTLKEVLNKLE